MTKHTGSMPSGFRQEDFLCFPYIRLCKTCDPWVGPALWPYNVQRRLFMFSLHKIVYLERGVTPRARDFVLPQWHI